jgi:hypothetical protein
MWRKFDRKANVQNRGFSLILFSSITATMIYDLEIYFKFFLHGAERQRQTLLVRKGSKTVRPFCLTPFAQSLPSRHYEAREVGLNGAMS